MDFLRRNTFTTSISNITLPNLDQLLEKLTPAQPRPNENATSAQTSSPKETTTSQKEVVSDQSSKEKTEDAPITITSNKTQERLTAMKGSLSGFSTYVTKSVKEAATTAAAKIKTAVEEEQKTFTSFLKETDDSQERERQRKEKVSKLRVPWDRIPIDDPTTRAEVEHLIQSLTNNNRNFLNAPPDDVNFKFNFDLEENILLAKMCLDADKSLAGVRFKLVPSHISEGGFWRNYFYRIWVIKASYGVADESLRDDPESGPVHPVTQQISTAPSQIIVPPASSTPSVTPSRDVSVDSTENSSQAEAVVDGQSISVNSPPLESLYEDTQNFAQQSPPLDELEFVSDNFDSEEFVSVRDTLQEPEEKTEMKDWESDWNHMENDELDVEIDEEWEAEMRRELEAMK
ncbi:synapse-associated protein 1-like [Planoprotostelium fungivorum]|uniref:Synapse-associated protein 1-like n=1 Tax=Planoprotostelium fungivorum TaxID=1890364 RepID=A0A2P6NFL7_9EUKA|nr:synapse-associated protein 1-like [Planoprotostelium fungivorum]PRP82759.1 synapse-associated protein 1-like [Planoprotostelium fungivorum]